MANALSVDLRERVVAAVSDGLSRRAAVARFGVRVSSAVRWVERARSSGGVAPKPQGGDQRSARIEVHAPLILGMVEKTPDVTLEELRAALAEQGIGAGIATLWRFFGLRAGSPRRPDAARGMVRGPTRPRSAAPGNRRRSSMAADSSPSCSKTARIAAASASVTTNMAGAWKVCPC
jgi:transposase